MNNLSMFDKYTDQGRKQDELKRSKFVIDIQPTEINMLIRYLMMVNVDRQNSINLNKLAYSIDPSIWTEGGQNFTMDSNECFKRLMFLRSLTTYHVAGIRDPEILFDAANRDMPSGSRMTYKEIGYDPNKKMQEGEVELCEQFITMMLNNLYLFENASALTTDLTKAVVSRDIQEKKAAIDRVNEKMSNMQREFKKNKPSTSKTEQMMTMDSAVLAMTQTRNDMMDSSRKLVTGYQGFNEVIGGALEGGNVYLIAGPAGTGKSLFVQNLGFSIRKHNPEFKTQNPEKTPLIVYLSQENTMKQTNQRTFYMAAGTTRLNPAEYDEARIVQMMQDSGFCANGERDIHFLTQYVPNRSIDTSYLYTLYENLYDKGYEMICLIHDHVKRIKSEERTADPRFELGNVINELKVFAARYDIPVIELCHTNRAGNSKMEVNESKYDLVKNYTRDTVGESLLMVDNADWFGTICSEFSEKWGNKKWIGLNVSKSRTSDSSNSIIYMPFEHETSLNLVEDLDSEKVSYKRTLNPNLDENGNMYGQSGVNGKPNPYTLNNNGFSDQEKVDKMLSESKSGSVNMSKKKRTSKKAKSMFETEFINGNGEVKKTEGANVSGIFDAIKKHEQEVKEPKNIFKWNFSITPQPATTINPVMDFKWSF